VLLITRVLLLAMLRGAAFLHMRHHRTRCILQQQRSL
jgi:hypothetical protein